MATRKRTILLVAAEKREFAGILRRCSGIARLGWPVVFARAGEMNGNRLVMVANGPGPVLAGAAADAAAGTEPDLVVSTGYCGGLDPELRAGDIFVASRVDAAGQGMSYEAVAPATDRRYFCGCLTSIDKVAQTVEDKRNLRQAGGAAVDMEAAAVGVRAGRWGRPFGCWRVVTDRADEGFAFDFNSVRDGKGRFSRLRIVRKAVQRPCVYVPELVRLERRCREAAETLGEFIAGCRF